MNALLLLLWLAALVQILIAASNFYLPRKLKYQENLERVAPIIRQIFVVHSVYIVGVLLLFAALTFGFGLS
jgi:ABC-type Na+ efflux pump permease subunit